MTFPVDRATVPRQARGLAFVVLDNEAVIYEPTQDKLFLLDARATLVWQLLDGSTTLGTTSDELAEEFGPGVETLWTDVKELTSTMLQDRLAEIETKKS